MSNHYENEYEELKMKYEEIQIILDNKTRQFEIDQRCYDDLLNKLENRIELLVNVNSQLKDINIIRENEIIKLSKENHELKLELNKLDIDLDHKQQLINMMHDKEKQQNIIIEKYEKKYSFIKEKYLNLKNQNDEKEKIINVEK